MKHTESKKWFDDTRVFWRSRLDAIPEQVREGDYTYRDAVGDIILIKGVINAMHAVMGALTALTEYWEKDQIDKN